MGGRHTLLRAKLFFTQGRTPIIHSQKLILRTEMSLCAVPFAADLLSFLLLLGAGLREGVLVESFAEMFPPICFAVLY